MPAEHTHEELPQRARRRKHAPAEKEAEASGNGAAAPAAHVNESSTDVQPRDRPDEWWYEYLDHTADVQLHSWAGTMEEMMELQGLAMFDYMTDRSTVDPAEKIEFTVTGAHSVDTLLFQFMDELLFHFSAELFTLKEVRITELDTENWTLKGVAWGEKWDRNKHAYGTEIKAITFGSMHIVPPGEVDEFEDEGTTHAPIDCWRAYVVVDI